MRKSKCHQYGAAKGRLYIPHRDGGRGLLSVVHVYEREVVSTAMYLCLNHDPQLQAVLQHQLTLSGMSGKGK